MYSSIPSFHKDANRSVRLYSILDLYRSSEIPLTTTGDSHMARCTELELILQAECLKFDFATNGLDFATATIHSARQFLGLVGGLRS